MADHLDMRFTSDRFWQQLVKASQTRWNVCTEKDSVLGAAGGREDIAKTLWASVADGYAEWLATANADIDGQRPIDLINSRQPRDTLRLRALIMQLPP